jgi:hypothetical protein
MGVGFWEGKAAAMYAGEEKSAIIVPLKSSDLLINAYQVFRVDERGAS